jgi:hypothetical protein
MLLEDDDHEDKDGNDLSIFDSIKARINDIALINKVLREALQNKDRLECLVIGFMMNDEVQTLRIGPIPSCIGIAECIKKESLSKWQVE